MASGKRNAGLRAHGAPAFEHPPGHFGIELVHRPTEDGDGHQWTSSHGIDVTDGIGRCDAAKSVCIVHDGHEKICGRDGGRTVAQIVDRCIVPCTMSHEQLRIVGLCAQFSEDTVEHARGNLAPTARSVAVLGQFD